MPTFGAFPIATIQPATVRGWVATMVDDGLSPSSVKATYGTFARIMKTAEVDGFIARSPCLGVSLPIWGAWQVATILGVIAGASVPQAWKLEFAAPLAFVAMSVPLLRDRAMAAAAVAAGVTVVLATPLPMRLGLVLAAVAGILAGLLAERKTA